MLAAINAPLDIGSILLQDALSPVYDVLTQLDTVAGITPEKTAVREEETFKQVLKKTETRKNTLDEENPTQPVDEAQPVKDEHTLTQGIDLQNIQMALMMNNDVIKPTQASVPSTTLEPNLLPSARMEIIAGIQQHLRQAIIHNGSLNIRVDDKNSVILRFSQKRVSAEYNTTEAKTAIQLQQFVQQIKNTAKTEQWPIDTVTYRHEQTNTKKQKKRQSK